MIKNSRPIDLIGRSILYAILITGGITMVIPFFWMISNSLKTIGEVFVFPPKWIPSQIKWNNYVEAWKAVPFGRFYINSIFVVIAITFGQVLTSSLAAYSFARLNFPGRDKIFFGYLATLMIPGAVTMIPVFCLLKVLGGIWDTPIYLGNIYIGKPIGVDSYFALIVPGMFSAYGTFLLRQFFLTIPIDLEEAAKIDGCSTFGIYSRIILPLSGPALATLTIFTFMGAWRDFMWPLIVTNSTEMKTLPVGLASFQGLYSTNWPYLMAGSMMVMAPLIVLFIFNQKYFVEGIKLTGIKG